MLVTTSLASPQRPPPVACVSLQPREKGKWLRSRKWGPSSCKEGDATEADWSPRGWRTPTAFGLLGWVVLCLLGAGEFQDTWARWLHLAGLISRHSLEAVPFSADSSSVSFPRRPRGSRSDPDPEIPHHRDQEAVDTALFSGYEPRRYVLVRTRPRAGSKADLLFKERSVY